MADIEMREERLRIQAQLMSDKQAKRRTQQMSGFQGGGRPGSAAGRRRPPSAAGRPQALSPVDGVSGVPVHQNGTSGFVNQAFDEPEITEVLSNMAPVSDQKPKIKQEVLKVEVEQTEISQKVEKLEISNHADPKSDSELEELEVIEKPKEKPKRKKRVPKPEPKEEPKPENINPPPPVGARGALVREDTVLFPGDEYYTEDLKNNENENIGSMETLQNAMINPEASVIPPDMRPVSRLSISTNAASAGIENIEEFVFQPAPQE